MTDASLQKVGCLVSELRAQLRFVKKTSIVPSAAVSAMSTFAHHAVATVVYQAVIQCTEHDWKSLMSPVDCKRAVEQLQATLAPKGVDLTKEMKDCLAEWESGAKLQKAEDTKKPAKEAKEPAVEPTKEPATVLEKTENTEKTASAMEVCEAQEEALTCRSLEGSGGQAQAGAAVIRR